MLLCPDRVFLGGTKCWRSVMKLNTNNAWVEETNGRDFDRIFFDINGAGHPGDKPLNQCYYLQVLATHGERVRTNRPESWENDSRVMGPYCLVCSKAVSGNKKKKKIELWCYIHQRFGPCEFRLFPQLIRKGV